MINRVFLILDQELASGGNLPSPDEHVFYSVAVDPAREGSLERAYRSMSDGALSDPKKTGAGLALTLHITVPLSAGSIMTIASFLFLPSYLRLEGRAVILLEGDQESAEALSAYLSGQGFDDPLIYRLFSEDVFRSEQEFMRHYESILRSDPCYGHTLFFNPSEAGSPSFAGSPSSALASLQSTFDSLRAAESTFREQDPRLYSLIQAWALLEEKFNSLQRKYTASALELQHQQQYVDILRSGHAAKEIQDFYTREYEILPLWYKRFGQVLKVLTGKRIFRSLFRDDTKKYKV